MEKVRIDIVSDVVCPWCAIGYKRLERALDELREEMRFEIDWHPFELNPGMAPEGENVAEHIARKYGITPEASAEARQRIAEAGRELGLAFDLSDERRIYNTFDAHRVLHWARLQGRQEAFNLALFEAYFARGENPSDPRVLERVAGSLSLDAEEVREILAGDRYAEEVRAEERRSAEAGIHAVPAFILNGQYLVSGAQEPETFVQVLRTVARKAQEAS